MSEHRKNFTEKKNKTHARFELAFFRTEVLDLDHYATAEDIVMLLPYIYIEFQRT